MSGTDRSTAPADGPGLAGADEAPDRPTPDPDPVDRSSTVVSAGISVLAALLAAGFAGAHTGVAGQIGVTGVALVGYGLFASEHRWIDYGTVALVCGVAVAGATGAGPRVTVPAALCAVLAWDTGGYAVRLGAELGREADTARAELVHAGLTLAVGVTAVFVAVGGYLVVSGEAPTLAVLLLFCGALALLVAVGERLEDDGRRLRP